jgi:hypothetical protein
MQKYALIQNGSVVRVDRLPVTWNNVSNFCALDPNVPNEMELIKANGWLPVETITENKDVIVSTNYIIEESLVKEIITTRDKTEEEINEEAKIQLANEWIPIRNYRDLLLKQTDTGVVSDKWEQMTAAHKQLWINYRQALRDIPQHFTNPSDVIWPTF